MAYNEELAGILRDELAKYSVITERRMFGGLCFMFNGNMLCGVHQDGGMARVGKALEANALEIDGIDPLSFTGRKMGGMVDVDATVFEDDAKLRAILSLALEFVESLPAK